MKIRDVIKTANSNLLRSKVRTFLTVSAVFMGALTLMLTTGVGSGLKSYVDEQVAGVGADDAMIINMARSSENPLSSDIKQYDPNKKADLSFGQMQTLTPNDIEKIRATKHIKEVYPLYSIEPLYVTAGHKKLVATVSQTIKGLKQPLTAGRLVDESSSHHEVTLPPGYSKALGFASDQAAAGKTVTFAFKNAMGQVFARDAKIVGVQQKSFINANAMTASTAFVKDVFDTATAGVPSQEKDKYFYAAAYFDTSISNQQLKDLKKKFKDMGYQAQTLDDQLGQIKSIIDGIITFLTIFGVITLLAATFGIVNTLLMSIQERTREIGLMKALGMSRRKIFTLFSLEAMLIGFWGSIVALAVANVIGAVGNKLASDTILKDFDGLQLMSFPLVPMVVIIIIIMAIAFLASTLPARRASRLDPIEALRYE